MTLSLETFFKVSGDNIILSSLKKKMIYDYLKSFVWFSQLRYLSCMLLATLLGGAPVRADTGPTYEFRCDLSRNQPPTTVLLTYNPLERETTEQRVIRWEASLGGYSPRERCIAVSERFQNLMLPSGRGMERIVIGYLNGNPSVCAAFERGDPCTRATLLFTLRDDRQLNNVVTRLESIFGGQASDGPFSQSDGSIHLNFMNVLTNESIELDDFLFVIKEEEEPA